MPADLPPRLGRRAVLAAAWLAAGLTASPWAWGNDAAAAAADRPGSSLPALAAPLPVRLARSGPQGQVLFERIALHAQAPAAWPQAGAGLDDFQRVDASNFGDMAYNPVVCKAHALDQRAGWRRTHAD